MEVEEIEELGMRIVVRIDDVVEGMDWGRFFRVKALLDEYGICPLIGVVPDNRDEKLCVGTGMEEPGDFWEFVKELKESGWVVAQHGWRHLYESKSGGMFPLNRFSEFAGLPYEVQLVKLGEGQRILREKGVETEFFMAPGHSYDRNTLRALVQLGFTGVTDGFGSRPYRWLGLAFYPISFHMGLSRRIKKGITTMVLHTNTMSEGEMESFKGLLECENFVSYGEFLETESVRRRVLGRLLEYLAAVFKRLTVKGSSLVRGSRSEEGR